MPNKEWHRRHGTNFAGSNDELQAYGYSEAPGNYILQLPLYGDESLPLEANALILHLTIKFILEIERLDQPIHFLTSTQIPQPSMRLMFLFAIT